MNGLEIINFLLKNDIDQSQFAKKAGFTGPQVSRWVKSKMELSKKSEIKVLNAFPLFYKDGFDQPMSKGKHNIQKVDQGVYQSRGLINVLDATTLEELMNPEKYEVGKIHISDFVDAEGGILMKGDAMAGKINGGDVMAHKEWQTREWFQYGMVHVIFSKGHSLVRVLRKHIDPNKILLQSNNAQYDDIDLPISDIDKLFIVNGALMRY